MKICFVIPYYNHPNSIGILVETLRQYHIDIIIIDDGSNAESKAVLKCLESKQIDFNDVELCDKEQILESKHIQHSTSQVYIYTRKVNGGKGAAIKDGLRCAKIIGFSHAFQIDADMQHEIGKINTFLLLSKVNPNALICGMPIYDETAPKSRLYGRKITQFWVHINTLSFSIKDAMCGFRIYPIHLINPLLRHCKGNKMDFDIEILVLTKRENIAMCWEEIRVFYHKENISHFSIKDNLLISKLHARYFLNLPLFMARKIKQKMINSNQNQWYDRNEKASAFWLNLTMACVMILPKPILKICIAFVSFIYFIFSINERKNIALFYQHLNAYAGAKPLHSFYNFYAFGMSICDKIAVYKGRITSKDIKIADIDFMRKELMQSPKGQIILSAHFGNIDIARAFSNEGKHIDLSIIMHKYNARVFLDFMRSISGEKLRVLYVEDFDIGVMLELKEILQNGGHIGIMGDRISIHKGKNSAINFLGEKAFFPQGAFLLSIILQCKISMLWCEKYKGKYHIELMPLNYEKSDTKRIISKETREESIAFLMEKFVREFENRVKHNPTQWFNFFNFWGQNVK